jgi:hypothetical protein
MIYFPPHLKYLSIDVDPDDPTSAVDAPPTSYGATAGGEQRTANANSHSLHLKTHIRTDIWRTSVVLTWVVVLHLLVAPIMNLFNQLNDYILIV